mmetsp:Transcript_94506/g.305153  ORF Transcript_94506/g.305153 Transcript_94506/m.305153 type:complete len:237 (+) Transcript_94506:58-768(+)
MSQGARAMSRLAPRAGPSAAGRLAVAALCCMRATASGLASGLATGALWVLLWGVLRGWLPWRPSKWRPGGRDFRWTRQTWSDSEVRSLEEWTAQGGVPEFGLPPKRNFLSPARDRRVSQQYLWFEASKRIRGLVRFGPGTSGPSGRVHCGCLGAVADAVMGLCAYKATLKYIVTRNLHVNYADSFVSPGCATRVDAWFEKVEGRKVFTGCSISSMDGEVEYCKCSALFIDVFGKKG